jgi:ABC-type glycerol-3-phosphate transport system substrate-binding protein
VDYGIAPHPYFAGGKVAMPTDSWSLGVSSYSKHQDAARKFVEYMAFTKEGSLHTIDQILIPPANKQAFSVYMAKLNASHPPATKGLGELMQEELDKAAVHRPHTPGYVQMQDVMARTFSDIRNGEDATKALNSAQDELKSAFEQYQ